MMNLSGMYAIDGIDLWDNYGVTVETGGLDGFLKLPKRKDSIQHDWQDEDGLDIDLSRTFFEAREIPINCVVVADSEAEFWTKYNGFLNALKKPGTRRLSVNPFGTDYYIFYKDCTIWQKLTNFKNSNKLVCRFTLTVIEKNPGFQNTPVYIVDEAGKFLIT